MESFISKLLHSTDTRSKQWPWWAIFDLCLSCFVKLSFSLWQDTSRGLCRVMVSFAETHLKLLFSADSEERELQGFTLVQLLLVRMWTHACNGIEIWQQKLVFMKNRHMPYSFIYIVYNQHTEMQHVKNCIHFRWKLMACGLFFFKLNRSNSLLT